MDAQYLTVSEVARRLQLSAESVRRLEGTGVLTAIRVGKGNRLFDPADVEKVRGERQKRAESRAQS